MAYRYSFVSPGATKTFYCCFETNLADGMWRSGSLLRLHVNLSRNYQLNVIDINLIRSKGSVDKFYIRNNN